MLKFVKGFVLCMVLSLSFVTAHAQVEAGSTTIPAVTGPTTWHAVTFLTPFASTPVVLASIDSTNPQPAALRIRNVTSTGFEISVREPAAEDGQTPEQSVDYLAGLVGVQTLPDGATQVEFGASTITNVQHGNGVPGGESWADINFTTPAIFGGTPPAVIASLQTDNNETTDPGAVSCAWRTEAIENVTVNDFDLAIERSEDRNCTVTVAETIGWIAVPDGASGSFVDGDGETIEFEARVSPNNVRGWGNGCFVQTLTGTYSTVPRVFASKNTHNGGDGGWIRSCNESTTQVGFRVDEDQFRDNERNHINEEVGYLIWTRKSHSFTKTLHQINRGSTILPLGATITDDDCVWFALQSQGVGTWYDVWESAGWSFGGVYESDLVTLITPLMTPTAQDVDSDGDDEQVLTINTAGSFEGYLELCVSL